MPGVAQSVELWIVIPIPPSNISGLALKSMQTKHLNADKSERWIYYPVPTPPPWHTQISASNCDYGLQYKSAVKRIFILFFTKMVMEGVWLWRISGGQSQEVMGLV